MLSVWASSRRAIHILAYLVKMRKCSVLELSVQECRLKEEAQDTTDPHPAQRLS